jgi:hypothetical protein
MARKGIETGRRYLEFRAYGNVDLTKWLQTKAGDRAVCRPGIPDYIRSDNGPEFTARTVRSWLSRLKVKPSYIEPGSPWEYGYIESFHGKFQDEFRNRELLDTLLEARVLTTRWQWEYNTFRHHSALNYRHPAPEAFEPSPVGPAPQRPYVAEATLTKVLKYLGITLIPAPPLTFCGAGEGNFTFLGSPSHRNVIMDVIGMISLNTPA